jgi:hypothetical protein
LWWDYRDYEGFSKTAFGISKEVRRRPSLTNGLDQAYQKAKKFSMDLSDEERTQELMNQLSLDSVSCRRIACLVWIPATPQYSCYVYPSVLQIYCF